MNIGYNIHYMCFLVCIAGTIFSSQVTQQQRSVLLELPTLVAQGNIDRVQQLVAQTLIF